MTGFNQLPYIYVQRRRRMLRKGKNHSGPEERRREIFHSVYCPKSGNLLMKCSCGTSQIVCPKCRAVIICRIWDNKVEIYEDRRQKEVML